MQARQIGDFQRPHGHLVLAFLAGDEAGGGIAGGEAGVGRNVLDANDHIGRDMQVRDRRLQVDGDAAQFTVAGIAFGGRLRLMLSEGLGFTHDSGWRRSC